MEPAFVRGALTALVIGISTAVAQAQDVSEPAPADRVQTALDDMHAWVGTDNNGRRWRTYLLSAHLERQLARGEDADPAALAAPLRRYQSGISGLERPQFVNVQHALAAWQRALQANGSPGLADLARAAGEQFQPISPAEVAAARQELQQAVEQLNRYLTAQGPNGEAWRDYLLLGQLEQQLAEDSPDLAELAEVYRRFRAIHEGLEITYFAQVADSLQRFINLANITRVQNQARQYQRQLDLLAEDLQAYEEDPTEERRFALGRRLGFVASLGQAPRLVEAVRRRLARPNFHARLSGDLLAAATVQPVNDVRPVTDLILGTQISGTAATDGQLHARTVPSGSGPGRIELMLSGQISSNTVGRNGPVCIYSTGQTPFCSLKTIFFDQHGFRELPASTEATTCTDIHCIVPVKGGIGSGLVQRIAWKRASQQKPQAEAIASEHAEARISSSFNTRTLDLLAEAHANYNRNFRLPLLRRDEFPELFEVRTTDDALWLTMVQATPYQLGAASPPPEPLGPYDLSVAIHESLPNNLASSFLSGYHLTDEWLRERIRRRGGDVPEELEADREPWSITFDDERPVSVSFEEGGVTLTIRGQRFTSGADEFGAMDITASYEFVMTDRGMILRRQGDLEILPPGFEPGTDRLSAEESALREILINRLGEVFKPEVRGEGIELPGELGRAGRLLPVASSSAEGWLLLGWNRVGPERSMMAESDAREHESVVPVSLAAE